MNKAKLKSYAPQARKDFIAAVTARANLLGLSEKAGKFDVAASQPQGDATVIAGQAWPLKVHGQRQQLIVRIQRDGFAQTMESVAYTWFNRFAALRYMELHDYLGHGHRALSSLDGTLPDILTHADDLIYDGEGSLSGLKPSLVLEMKLAGNRDGELYRMLLVAQCNALSNIMPFLFERIDDETELLLPDNLLRTDSVIAKLVNSIDEEDWKEVEIIGWLYQFYISEKKDEVIGKVVKSEDIPAATQLFTPNWIVQYLVQNSVGRLWLMANPASTLQSHWPYYVAPADQTLEVRAQLDALIQTRMNEDGGSLNPETMTMLDPACGSGHILVEAYEVFKAIYLERGYQSRSIPRLILEKNLYGLDIDDRASQMAGFALLMKARADDRRLLNNPVRLNVLSLQQSKGLNADELARALHSVAAQATASSSDSAAKSEFGEDDLFPGVRAQFFPRDSSAKSVVGDSLSDPVQTAISSLIATFEDAKTFGSLIRISPSLNGQLAAVADRLQSAFSSGDLYAQAAARDLLPLLAQARLLGMQFDAVVANPPYMGRKSLNGQLKKFAEERYSDSKSDLFSMFIERAILFSNIAGEVACVAMHSWMFLSSYEKFRKKILKKTTISSLAHLGARAFSTISGDVVQVAAFILTNNRIEDYCGKFFRLVDLPEAQKAIGIRSQLNVYSSIRQREFSEIPGAPIAYWLSEKFRATFSKFDGLGNISEIRGGMHTGDNQRFLRRWSEVSFSNISFYCRSHEESKEISTKWFPYNKGGDLRKWFGNRELIVNWAHGGQEIHEFNDKPMDYNGAPVRAKPFQFREAITWSDIASKNFAARYSPEGAMFDVKGSSAFPDGKYFYYILALMCSPLIVDYMNALNPSVTFQVGDIARVPLPPLERMSSEIELNARECISLAKIDWDSSELSWDFLRLPFLNSECKNLKAAYEKWANSCFISREIVLKNERRNTDLLVQAFGLHNDVKFSLEDSDLTLNSPERSADARNLMSFAIGCMMGRYSLDEHGLIYANAGSVGFDATRYNTFPADFDGIVPLNDKIWFEDEAASRIREFLSAVWGTDTLAENMAWLAESVGAKTSETPDETIRRYLADKFYKCQDRPGYIRV